MTDGDRLRALLARAARAGGDDPRRAGLHALLQRLDATVLPRRVTVLAGSASLELAAVERRLVAVNGAAVPDGPGAAGEVGALLSRHLAGDPSPRMSEGPWPPGAAWDPSRGLSVRAIAGAGGVELWPDRSLAARLEAWVMTMDRRDVAAAGYGALSGSGIGWGDAAVLAGALDRLAPEGPEALVARGLGGPAGGAAGEAGPGLVARAGADGSAVLVAGSPEGGVVVLARLADLPDLIREWQAG
jgi:hypothetical protein